MSRFFWVFLSKKNTKTCYLDGKWADSDLHCWKNTSGILFDTGECWDIRRASARSHPVRLWFVTYVVTSRVSVKVDHMASVLSLGFEILLCLKHHHLPVLLVFLRMIELRTLQLVNLGIRNHRSIRWLQVLIFTKYWKFWYKRYLDLNTLFLLYALLLLKGITTQIN